MDGENSGKSYYNGWFGGTIAFGNTHIVFVQQSRKKKLQIRYSDHWFSRPISPGRGGCYKHSFYGITSYQCNRAECFTCAFYPKLPMSCCGMTWLCSGLVRCVVMWPVRSWKSWVHISLLKKSPEKMGTSTRICGSNWVVVSNIFFYVHPENWGNDPIWLPSLKLTYPLKIGLPKRKLVFQPSIFRCYVSLPEGNIFQMGGSTTNYVNIGKLQRPTWVTESRWIMVV